MIESIHSEAERYGIDKPELERREYREGEVLVSALTSESELLWLNYTRRVTLARMAFYSMDNAI